MNKIAGKHATFVFDEFVAQSQKKEIFVFGSNTAGIHGAGAAFTAYTHHGAIMGIGYGLTGKSFAIPTKGGTNYVGKPLSLDAIENYIRGFVEFTRDRPDLLFKITQIGCGLAGHKVKDITRLFVDNNPPNSNCFFDSAWKEYLPERYLFWGTR